MSDSRLLPLLAVDIGNSSIQFGFFPAPNRNTLPTPQRSLQLDTSQVDFDSLTCWLPEEPLSWFVASVHRPSFLGLQQWLATCRTQDEHHLLAVADLPLSVEVDYPERVGMDRLVAAVAANCLRSSNRPAIVIDAGTAITVDAVSAGGAFLGGAILPGMGLTAAALSGNTDLLPIVLPDPDSQPSAIGKSTERAIESGLFWGSIGAIRQLIQQLSLELPPDPQLIFTGGDAMRVSPWVCENPQQVPDLVLSGIALSAWHASTWHTSQKANPNQ